MQYPSFPMYAHRLFLMHVCRRLHAGAPSFLCLCTAFLLLCVLFRSPPDTVLCMALRQILFYALHDHLPHDSEVTEILRQGFRKLPHFAFLICYTSSRLYISEEGRSCLYAKRTRSVGAFSAGRFAEDFFEVHYGKILSDRLAGRPQQIPRHAQLRIFKAWNQRSLRAHRSR